jgi:small conductance mechanosensitive channel
MFFLDEVETTAAETLEVVQEVQQDLEQLKPNAVLETVKSWIPSLTRLGYRLLVAAVIVLIGFQIAKAVRKMLERSLIRVDMDVSIRKFLQSAVYVAICGLAIFIAADKLGISSASIVAILGSVGLALSLSLQGMLANFAGGIVLLLIRPFKVGDYIICGGQEGTVRSIGLIYTTLTTVDNKQVVFPNGSLSNTNLVNVTAQEKRCLELKVGIGYGSDLKKAKEIIEGLYVNHPLVLKDQPVTVFVDELADSAVVIGARGWVATGDYGQVRWDLTEKVKLEYDAAGIEIPFQQLDVNVKR